MSCVLQLDDAECTATGAHQAARHHDAKVAPEEAGLVAVLGLHPHACSGDNPHASACNFSQMSTEYDCRLRRDLRATVAGILLWLQWHASNEHWLNLLIQVSAFGHLAMLGL